MKAIIMAGGEGTRLRPLTCSRPKPMVPVANKPIMEHIINLLKKHGINDIAVTLQYLPAHIKDYFGDGTQFGVKLQYFVEKKPLGTAGSVKNCSGMIDEPFLVISGDALTDIDLSQAIAFHQEKKSLVTLVLKKVPVPLEYGVVVTDHDGRIVRFLEKPGWGEVFSDTANTGIYIVEPEAMRVFNENTIFDFSKDLFPKLLSSGQRMFGFVTSDYWCDIGDVEAYMQANTDVLNGKVRAEIPGRQLRPGVWIGENCDIDFSAIIEAPCVIGSNTFVGANALIGANSVIGENSIVERSASLKRSMIWKGCHVLSHAELRGALLLARVSVREGAGVFEQAVIGDNTCIEENAVVKPSVRIWPDKRIEAGTEVGTNLVWGTRRTKSIFGSRGVSGAVNTDIDPEYASRLGAAYGAGVGAGKTIGIATDDSPASVMLELAFVSGMISAGIRVVRFGKLLMPMLRQAVRFHRLGGGIMLCSGVGENRRFFVEFLDQTGVTVNRNMERKIESAFSREDFARCEEHALDYPVLLEKFSHYYVRQIINGMKSHGRTIKVAVISPSHFVFDTAKEILGTAGIRVESAQAGYDLEQELRRIKSATRSDIAAYIDEWGERLVFLDESGRLLDEDMQIAMTTLIHFERGGTSELVVPYFASDVVETIAAGYKGSIIRAKAAEQDILEKIVHVEPDSDTPKQFLRFFDGLWTLANIMDYLCEKDIKLGDLASMIPDFHMSRTEVECPWDLKGRVIREIMQDGDYAGIDTNEGVKVLHDGGWVLVLPDSERPVCRIIGEGCTTEFAEELTSVYAERIRRISMNTELN